MANSTLSNLSKLALQVRNEHLCTKNRKDWLKKQFQDQNPATSEETRPLVPVGAAATAQSSSHFTLPGNFTQISSENESLADSEDINYDERPSVSCSVIGELINSYQSQLTDDEKDTQPLFSKHTCHYDTIWFFFSTFYFHGS
jgi:hypothetical protein